MADVAAAVESSSPLALLEVVSAIAAMELKGRDPFAREPVEALPSYDELLDSFVEVAIPETSAILAVAAATHPDELFRMRVRRELIERRHRLPGWLRQLDLTVTGAQRVSEPFGDGEDIVLGVRVGSHQEFTFVVYIDHQSGSVVKDAFVIERPMTDSMLAMAGRPGADEIRFTNIDRAEARAKLDESVQNGAMLWPPHESETWPAVRPLLTWVLAVMPEGGSVWERPEWSETDRTQLAESFFASPRGRSMDGADQRDIVETLIWYGADYGTGDPRRWSPTSLEILLLDWIPRKIVADAEYLDAIPGVLRAFIPYAHGVCGIEPDLNESALKALAEFEPEYRRPRQR